MASQDDNIDDIDIIKELALKTGLSTQSKQKKQTTSKKRSYNVNFSKTMVLNSHQSSA